MLVLIWNGIMQRIINHERFKWVQMFVGVLLYYGRAANNKLLTALSAIGSQQTKPTENNKKH